MMVVEVDRSSWTWVVCLFICFEMEPMRPVGCEETKKLGVTSRVSWLEQVSDGNELSVCRESQDSGEGDKGCACLLFQEFSSQPIRNASAHHTQLGKRRNVLAFICIG